MLSFLRAPGLKSVYIEFVPENLTLGTTVVHSMTLCKSHRTTVSPVFDGMEVTLI